MIYKVPCLLFFSSLYYLFTILKYGRTTLSDWLSVYQKKTPQGHVRNAKNPNNLSKSKVAPELAEGRRPHDFSAAAV
jgi:hypothetical protein